MYDTPVKQESSSYHIPWNKGKLIGQKPPLKREAIWAVRIRVRIAGRIRDLALFHFAIDSKLRGCDLVQIRVRDVVHGEHVLSRGSVIQQKTGQPVRFEITQQMQALECITSDYATIGGV